MVHELDFYPKKIKGPNFVDTIDEKFDGVSTFLTENSFFYGSTVSSLVAELPIVGDLDIAIPKEEYNFVAKKFANSAKWLQLSGSRVREDDPTDGEGLPRSWRGSTKPQKAEVAPDWKPSSSEYEELPHIGSVITFQNILGIKVQLMCATETKMILREQSLNIVKKVDLLCCSVAIDYDGNIFETVKGAYSDCRNRIVRLNPEGVLVEKNRTLERIHKYLERGWSLAESLDSLNAKLSSMKVDKKQKKIHKMVLTSIPRWGSTFLVHTGVIEKLSMSKLVDTLKKVLKVSPDYKLSILSGIDQYANIEEDNPGYTSFYIPKIFEHVSTDFFTEGRFERELTLLLQKMLITHNEKNEQIKRMYTLAAEAKPIFDYGTSWTTITTSDSSTTVS